MGKESFGCALGESCCGCGACAAVCPVACIVMQPDGCGFFYPKVNVAECKRCGRCEIVCPALDARRPHQNGCHGNESYGEEALPDPSAWWAYAEDEALRARSSSGGVFGLLARDVLGRGGAVYGVAFEKGCASVSHTRVATVEGLSVLMRSKYMQSCVSCIEYERLADDVSQGIPVLFVGTACQVAGVRAYLSSRHISCASLVTADVVCHGAPAPALWAACIHAAERRLGARVDAVNFRDKRTGWETYSVTLHAQNGRELSFPWARSWYMAAFLKSASLRPACFTCPFKCTACGSDLTLGDYWGIRETHPDVDSDLGVSAVIAHTGVGASAFKRIDGLTVCGLSSLAHIAAHNPSLVNPPKPYGRHEEFLSDVARGLSLRALRRRWGFGLTLHDRLLRVLCGRK